LPAAKSVVFRKGAEDRVCRPAPAEEPRSDAETAIAELAAVADGLTRLPKVPSRTTAWVATDLTGTPDRPAKVLGDIATRTTMPVPLDGIVAGLRAFVEVRSQAGQTHTDPTPAETAPAETAPGGSAPAGSAPGDPSQS
jgi:hypothetical protein